MEGFGEEVLGHQRARGKVDGQPHTQVQYTYQNSDSRPCWPAGSHGPEHLPNPHDCPRSSPGSLQTFPECNN